MEPGLCDQFLIAIDQNQQDLAVLGRLDIADGPKGDPDGSVDLDTNVTVMQVLDRGKFGALQSTARPRGDAEVMILDPDHKNV